MAILDRMRGFSDDEDEEGLGGKKMRPKARTRVRKPLEGRARLLPPEKGNATVAEIFPNQSAVRFDGSEGRVLCGYRMATLASGGPGRERSPVCVGDRVLVEAGVIVSRCERRNTLIRSAPNARTPLRHAVAANIDVLVVVASAREPEFSSGIVDRFLVAASSQDIPAILCVNKLDLLDAAEAKPWAYYPEIPVPVAQVCARSGAGVEELASLLRGKTAAFCGHSGVGKTSLLRRLLKDDSFGRVGAVNTNKGKGRHTTTGAVLLPAAGSTWIDTPGIMNFGLVDIGRENLLSHFPELSRAAARCGLNCGHDAEEGCALRPLPRYESFQQILGSL